MSGPQKVFPGREQESRYGKILKYILGNIPETMLERIKKTLERILQGKNQQTKG